MSTDDELLTPEDVGINPYFGLPTEVPEAPEEEEKSGPDKTSQFDQRHREPFLGLLYLGKLTDTVTHFGHSFRLDTPSQNERLEAGLLHKQYLNSLASEQGWVTIMVALFLRKVDDTDLPMPIGPKDTGLTDRFHWVKENLTHPVVNRVFEDCLKLDDTVTKALGELERLGES